MKALLAHRFQKKCSLKNDVTSKYKHMTAELKQGGFTGGKQSVNMENLTDLETSSIPWSYRI